MAYEYGTKTEDGVAHVIEWTDPVVVIVATGTHDVSRLVQAMRSGTCEQGRLGEKIARSLKRGTTGRNAIELLKRHGGEDLTELKPLPTATELLEAIGLDCVRGVWISVDGERIIDEDSAVVVLSKLGVIK